MEKRDHQIGVGTMEIPELAVAYINKALRNNRLSYGPFSEKFENLFAKMHNRRFAILSNSGTSSLQVALAALKEKYGWADGDEVLVPAVTFVATANIVLQNQMVPVFIEVDRHTYNLNPYHLEAWISPKTRAIVPVHLFGMSADMAEIKEVADDHGLKILEDSCECMFVKYQGQPVGSTGDIACFSTYVAHLLVTGVGGLALTDDPDLAVLLRSLCNHGRDSIYLQIDDDKDGSKDLKQVVARRFSFERLGYSYRITELEAALGLAQLELDPMVDIAKRRTNAMFLSSGLKEFGEDLQLPYCPNDRDHAFMMFPIVIRENSSIKREDLLTHLEEHNIETRPMLPLINQPCYKKLFGSLEKDYPVASWINENGFYIGCHQSLSRYDLQYIVKVFKDFFK